MSYNKKIINKILTLPFSQERLCKSKTRTIDSRVIFYMYPKPDINKGIIPVKENHDSPGYTLFSPYNFTVNPGEKVTIPLNLTIAFPRGFYGTIFPYTRDLDAHADIIDSNCTHNINVLLLNHGKTAIIINRGDKIAKIIISKYLNCGFGTDVIWGTEDDLN